MDANEGVQSFNFEVGQKFKEFESQLKPRCKIYTNVQKE